jgi:hypothetical protein
MSISDNNFYNSIRTIPVYNFYLLHQEKDLRYLHRNFEEGSDEQLSEEQIIEAESIKASLMEDYIDALSDGKGRSDMLIVGQIGDMEVEIMVIGSILQMMILNPSEALKTCLKDWKYPTDIEKAKKKLDGVKFRHSILVSKNKHLFEKEDKDKDVQYDLYKDVVLLEQSLGSTLIDPKTCVLEKWINYLKLAKEKNKPKRKNDYGK